LAPKEFFSAITTYFNEDSPLFPSWGAKLLIFGGRGNQSDVLNSTIVFDPGD
jgi:hypothetical protein